MDAGLGDGVDRDHPTRQIPHAHRLRVWMPPFQPARPGSYFHLGRRNLTVTRQLANNQSNMDQMQNHGTYVVGCCY